jgi:aryl-alcohol dehydrogenase-like predicted oxidoreductase
MTDIAPAGEYPLGPRSVNRLGYGAMQLAVLRAAVAVGVNHIDTSDFYGPHVTNRLIREALHPYPETLVIVTKVGAVRGADASWNQALSAKDITAAVHDNLRNLDLDVLDVVNLRVGGIHGPSEGSIEAPLTALAQLREKGLIRDIGLSNVTSAQIAQGRAITKIVCVQNHYNLIHRDDDDLIDQLSAQGIAYAPFFPLGGFTPLQSSTLTETAAVFGATAMQVALAWLLRRAPNILLIPGTASLDHLHQNLAAASLTLSEEVMDRLNAISGAGAE